MDLINIMIVQLFGILDILAALSIVLLKFKLFNIFALALGIYLVIKGLLFIKSLVSWIDLICGIIIIISYFGFFSILSWIVALWLLQKGAFSLVKS